MKDVKTLIEKVDSLSDLSRILFGDNSSKHREECKIILAQNGIDYLLWKADKNEVKRKYCLFCGKEILGRDRKRRKFCSHSCAANYNNKLKFSTIVTQNNKNCLYCGKPLKKTKTFCSHVCQIKHQNEEYIKKWQNGLITGMVGKDGLSKRIRDYLLAKNNFKCQKCGWCQVNIFTNKIPLQIHHIDGDCTNNNENNLEVLCPNCHSLTANYGNTKQHKSNRIDKRLKRKK